MDEQGDLFGRPEARGRARWQALRANIDAAFGEGWRRADNTSKAGWPPIFLARCYEGWRHEASGRLVVLRVELGEHPDLVACWPRSVKMKRAEWMSWNGRLALSWRVLWVAARTVAACAPDVPASCLARELEARAAFLDLVTDGGEE